MITKTRAATHRCLMGITGREAKETAMGRMDLWIFGPWRTCTIAKENLFTAFFPLLLLFLSRISYKKKESGRGAALAKTKRKPMVWSLLFFLHEISSADSSWTSLRLCEDFFAFLVSHPPTLFSLIILLLLSPRVKGMKG